MNIHLIAVGGSVMHNLALALQCNLHTVSGSDDEIYDPARSRLKNKGLLPDEMGWNADRIHAGLDAVIVGMHARPDNPELLRAQELGIPIHSFPSYLAMHAKDKKRVVVGGSHGKTTTTSMIMHVLKYYEHDFDYMVGAQLEGFETMVRLSDAPLIILEGDEYLSSPLDRRSKFLHYQPHLSILTGIAWDHINVFPTFDSYRQTFVDFLTCMNWPAKLFYFGADEELQQIVAVPNEQLTSMPYGALEAVLKEGQTFLRDGEDLIGPLTVFGQHNLQNMQAAQLVCAELGIEKRAFMEAILSFNGAAKRLQTLVKRPNAIAYQDFAHAPSKAKATIQAVKAQYPERQLVAALELHTFSSLNKEFLSQYAGSMKPADHALVYFSKHTLKMKRLPDISMEEVRAAFGRADLQVFNERDELVDYLKKLSWEDQNLLLMSSGTFGGLDLAALSAELL